MKFTITYTGVVSQRNWDSKNRLGSFTPRQGPHHPIYPQCQIMPWITVYQQLSHTSAMIGTLEDNVVNIISHDWCSVPNHALGKRRKYLHRRAMINTLEDNVVNILPVPVHHTNWRVWLSRNPIIVSVTPTGLHIGILCLQIGQAILQKFQKKNTANKKRYFKFEQKLQISVLILCCYEWKIKQDLSYPYTSYKGLNPLLHESNLGK